MEIKIDTSKDSKKDIAKVIGLLQDLINDDSAKSVYDETPVQENVGFFDRDLSISEKPSTIKDDLDSDLFSVFDSDSSDTKSFNESSSDLKQDVPTPSSSRSGLDLEFKDDSKPSTSSSVPSYHSFDYFDKPRSSNIDNSSSVSSSASSSTNSSSSNLSTSDNSNDVKSSTKFRDPNTDLFSIFNSGSNSDNKDKRIIPY
ncbi:hypothetical protein KO361_01260 [Candidatus Woesearchaeota archaeon]|nr:hypothetical protein [Candidatus Woesearchaeota archaeon]